MDLEAEIKSLFDEALRGDTVVQVFSSFIKHEKDDYENRMSRSVARFKSVFMSTDAQTTCITILIKYVHNEKMARRINFLFDFIQTCIQEGFLPLKSTLDNLQCPELTYTKKLHWCQTYELIRKFIHLIDYKGCRNLLHGMIVKMKEIPPSAWNEAIQQVDAICKTIEHLLDPNSCLLPGYLAVNEIKQNLPEQPLIAPWPLCNKLTSVIDRFRATATMVSTTGRWMLFPVVDHAFYQLTSTWRLDSETLRFPLRRQLPFAKEMYQRQWKLLHYILKQTYSRDMVLQVLGLQKQQKQNTSRCIALETELVALMLNSMEDCLPLEEELSTVEVATKNSDRLLWQHLAAQLIYFVLYELVNFPEFVEELHRKLLVRLKSNRKDIRQGRDYLMWGLLQYVSGSVSKNPLNDFLPVIKLIHLLYPEQEPLPLPDVSKSSSALSFSAMCILMHLNCKAQNSSQADSTSGSTNNLSKPTQRWDIPIALQKQHHYLKHCLQTPNVGLQDYQIALVCNACSTTTDPFNGPITRLVDSVYGDAASTPMPGHGCVAFNKTSPLKMELLDSLTAHTKMSMLHDIGSKIKALSQSKSSTALSPALAETYSRLLVYTEIESLGMKGFILQVLPNVKSLGVFHTMLEMISYRMHHIQPSFRVQLLTTLHSIAGIPRCENYQLRVSVESTALRLIMGFDNFDIKPQLVRSFNDKKPIISQNSEELNRVFVLTLARSIHITGTETISGPWCIDILKAVTTATPLKWPKETLECFPQSIQDYYKQQSVECVNKELLKSSVDEEYAKWGPVLTLSSQEGTSPSKADAMTYFSQPSSSQYFICLLWKILLDGKTPSMTSYSILENMGASQLSVQVCTFSDFLIHEFSVADQYFVTTCADVLRDMVWKYNIVLLDKLILYLALRSSEPNHVSVSIFIIHYLLIKPDNFRMRVRSFAPDIETTDHWMEENWHSKHMAFHQEFPEMFYFEGLLAHCSTADGNSTGGTPPTKTREYLPTYFSNITLRFLPVLDIVIHRCIEFSSMSLEALLNHFGLLYKFHDQPITYLFNTLHYYETRLRDWYPIKKKLVSTIIAAISKNKPANWSLSPDFMHHVINQENTSWKATPSYYVALVRRLVDTIRGKVPLPFTPRDWRFNEFQNASALALRVTCVEVLALPTPGDQVGQDLMNVVLETHPVVDRDDIFSWMNSVALILTSLPEIFWKPLHQNILSILQCDVLKSPISEGASYPYHILSYDKQQVTYNDLPCTRLLALTHIVWHHMSIGQLSVVSQFLKEEVKPLVETELQLLYVFHLIGPYFPRFRLERTRCMIDVASVLYDILLRVSKSTSTLHFVDEIADFLYDVKYMHIGTAINDKVDEVVVQLQPVLRSRLQFITNAPTAGGRQQINFATANT